MRVLVLLLLLLLVATQARAQPVPLLLGIEGPINSFSGDEENLGFRMAFRDANAQGGIGGRPIELRGYPRDGGAAIDQAMANARRLVEADGVFALVSFGGPVAIPLAAYAEANRVPYLFPHTALIDSANKRYLFTSFPGYAGEAEVMLRYLAGERGARRIDIVHDANVYGQQFLGWVRDDAGRFGYEFAGNAPVSTREPGDLAPALRTLAGADTVVMALYPAQAKALMAAKAAENWAGRLVSVGPLTDEAYLVLPGGVAEGTLGFCYYPDPERSAAPGVAAYRDALARDPSGHTPNRYSLYGYVFGRLIVEGLRRAGPDATRDQFIDALERVTGWDSGGILPPVTMTPGDHHAQTAGFICELTDGRFRPLSGWSTP